MNSETVVLLGTLMLNLQIFYLSTVQIHINSNIMETLNRDSNSLDDTYSTYIILEL